MSACQRPDAEAIRRRGIVVATAPGSVELRWTESQCRGCVGCGGRCGLFSSNDAGVARLPCDAAALRPGDAIDVEIGAPRLRRAASVAYGLAVIALVAGAALGHAVGGRFASANVGAFVGLLLGTFMAGALTKRLDASPPLHLRRVPDAHSESHPESEELPR